MTLPSRRRTTGKETALGTAGQTKLEVESPASATHDGGAGLGERTDSRMRQEAAPTRHGGLAAAAGIAAIAGGVVAGELLAGFASPSLSPLTAVGGAVIDAVPPGLKDWAISLFGTADKAALLAGMPAGEVRWRQK